MSGPAEDDALGAVGDGDSLGQVLAREASAVEKRNWVRLTRTCNNRCTFCLDSDNHDGEQIPEMAIKAQIVDGRKQGATRLILSGGEPTVHAKFVEFVRLGRKVGYRRVQTVTNGRMFAYDSFARAALDAGLQEVTFSLHGHTPKLHDALVGVPGAFDEEIAGLRAVQRDGRAIVNIDIVLNRKNVPYLREMLLTFMRMGVLEFDLLQIIPFGRAYSDEYRDGLFYDLEEAHPHIQAALELKKRPGVHIWCNRFPVANLEGHEELIQDPHKMFDEVRGRYEEYRAYLDRGKMLECRGARCRHCYMQVYCDTFFDTAERMDADSGFEALRLDLVHGRPALPARLPRFASLWIVAPSAAEVPALADLPGERAVLDLADWSGVAALPEGKPIARLCVGQGAEIDRVLALAAGREVKIWLNRSTAPWVAEHLRVARPGVVLGYRTHELLSESVRDDVDLRAFFASNPPAVAVEDVPACIAGDAARPSPRVLDAAALDASGRLDVFGYVGHFVMERYYKKSLRCRDCVKDAECRGIHINYIRNRGLSQLVPIARSGPSTCVNDECCAAG